MTEVLQTFTPDWISPPGETIADLIEERDWSQVDLAKRLGYTTKHISLLIDGKASITKEKAGVVAPAFLYFFLRCSNQ